MSKRDFLFELGTEELPPKSLFTLAQALADGVAKGLAAAAIAHGELEWFATPRRLAVRVHAMADKQPDQEIKRQGPAVANAFDAAGQPTKAAVGFAASCGVSVEELQQVDGPKGRVLHVRRHRGKENRLQRCCQPSSNRRSTPCRLPSACAGARAITSSFVPCIG